MRLFLAGLLALCWPCIFVIFNALVRPPSPYIFIYTLYVYDVADVVGKVYSVISKRKGKVISENMKEDSDYFIIQALIPAVESIGFSDEIRKKTSGLAHPQLIFQGFDVLDQDPFWVPSTKEELEDLGEKADRENIAKKYLEDVRKRKGLFIEKKIVDFAEKQRTLKK